MSSTNITVDDKCKEIIANSKNLGYAVGMSFILFGSITGNSLVIFTTLYSRLLRRRVMFYLILSLACSDIFLAATQIPLNILQHLHNNKASCISLPICYFKQISDIVANISSILSLFWIGIERYILFSYHRFILLCRLARFVSIKFPFQRECIFSRRRTNRLIIFIWIFSLGWAVSGLFSWGKKGILTVQVSNDLCANNNLGYYIYTYILIYLIPLGILTFTYLMILKIAIVQIRLTERYKAKFHQSHQAKFHKSIRDNTSVSVPNNLNGSTKKTDTANNNIVNNNDNKRGRRWKELKATKSVAMVYFTFLLCWLPKCILTMLRTYEPKMIAQLYFENQEAFWSFFYLFFHVLPMLNTMVNPVIYSFTYNGFRSEVKRRFKEFFSTSSSGVYNSKRPRNSTSLMTSSSLSISRSRCDTRL